jgi:tetratricopeptide (TPR) repeat protein
VAHVWIVGAASHERLAAAAALGRPMLVPPVDAHRRLRGPYTMGGTVFRALAPDMLAKSPDLLRRRDIEVLSVAPEVRDVIPASRETLTSLAIPGERSRFYSAVRTLRMSHGLTELLRDHLHHIDGTGAMLVVDRVDDADATDIELLTVMLRRLDPAVLTVVVCSATANLPEALRDALARYAERHDAPVLPWPPADHPDLARAYVDTDGVSDDPRLIAAYQALDPKHRADLHRDRADVVAATGEFSATLGALPYHRERAGDPKAAALALLDALNYCVNMGFYQATEDLGRRGRSIVDRRESEALWWAYTTKMTTSLSILGRPKEAEALYDDARATTTNPLIHRQSAYATAMIYTRHHAPEDRDHTRARAWINEAIVIATLIGAENGQIFPLVFQQNGLALIEMHLGNLPGALELVDGGLARLDRELGADEHRLHRSVLLHNRAQVYSGLGRLEDALADFDRVIAVDPNYPEYHFDRANLLHRLGRDHEALDEYAAAIRLGPPFPEAHYNRSQVLTDLGDLEAARADLDYVLELDPTNIDAWVNRAGLLATLGDDESMAHNVHAGLVLDNDNPHLLALLGQIHADNGDTDQAESAYLRALSGDPNLPAALAGLATLAYDAGHWSDALRWLDRAIEGGDDAALRFNRAKVHEAAGDHARALSDLDRAVDLDPSDDEVRAERDAYRHRPATVPTAG